MSTPVWTLRNLTTGASGTVGDHFGFSGPVLELASQDAGSLSLERSGSLDDPWQFQEGDRVGLYRDGAVWFVGACIPGAMNGSPNSESASYRIVDDLYWMGRTVYRKRWTGNIAASAATGGYWSGHLMLNYEPTTGWLTTRGEAQQILAYATNTDTDGPNAGVGLQFDHDYTEFPNQVVWMDEVRNITLLEALRKELRFFPQAALWLDHSAATGAPAKPRLRCRTWDAMDRVTLPLAASAGESWHEGVSVARAWDQELPSVHVQYEKTGTVTVGDQTYSYITVELDRAPTGSHGFEVGALHTNVALMGSVANSLKQTIYTLPFTPMAGGGDAASANADRLGWWRRHCPGLSDGMTGVTKVTYMQRGASGEWVAATGATPPDYELVDGTWSDWMPIAGGTVTPSTCYELGVSGVVHYDRASVACTGFSGQARQVPMTGAVNVTDVYGGLGGTDYTVMTSYQPDEPTPVGLADLVYQALKGPLFSGSVTYVAQECDGAGGLARLGAKVCLDMRNATGGVDESNTDYALWRAMDATVQRVRYELETGRTTVSFGPPKHLGIPDLVDLLRQGRFRQKWSNPRMLATGDLSSAAVQAGDRVFKEVKSAGVSNPSRAEVGGFGGGGTVHFDGG